MQPGDVVETFSDIKKSTEMLNFSPLVDASVGIKNFIEWYISFKKKLSEKSY